MLHLVCWRLWMIIKFVGEWNREDYSIVFAITAAVLYFLYIFYTFTWFYIASLIPVSQTENRWSKWTDRVNDTRLRANIRAHDKHRRYVLNQTETWSTSGRIQHQKNQTRQKGPDPDPYAPNTTPTKHSQNQNQQKLEKRKIEQDTDNIKNVC